MESALSAIRVHLVHDGSAKVPLPLLSVFLLLLLSFLSLPVSGGKKYCPDRGLNISRARFGASPLLSIPSSCQLLAPTTSVGSAIEKRQRQRCELSRFCPRRCIYTLGITNYADNRRRTAGKHSSTKEGPDRAALLAHLSTATFSTFFDTHPPVSTGRSLFPNTLQRP